MNLPCTLAMLFSCFPFPEKSDKTFQFFEASQTSEAPSASELLRHLDPEADVVSREKEILNWFTAGDIPHKLTQFKAVQVFARGHHLTYWVAPDYLSFGNDSEAVLTPLSWTSAKILAAKWQMLLPTSKMVDQIYQQADRIYWPHAYPPSETMRSTHYLLEHDKWIKGVAFWDDKINPLVAGHKKDLVVSPRLLKQPSKLAIYGWHNLGNGAAIQPLSLWHGQFYVDYSHGIRLVAPEAELDGKRADLRSILRDPLLAPLVSLEGAFDICEVLGYVCPEP